MEKPKTQPQRRPEGAELPAAICSMSAGVAAIARERQRQIEQEGWTPEHDDAHAKGELAHGAVCYAALEANRLSHPRYHEDRKNTPPPGWPWDREWWKPSDDSIRNLEKAGALIAAEIDRLTRASNDQVEARRK